MKDWGWESKEKYDHNYAGFFFLIRFDQLNLTKKDLYLWAENIQLPDYQRFTGPMKDDDEVCRFFAKDHYDELVDQYVTGKSIPYSSLIHQINIYTDRVLFLRVRGETNAADSDRLFLESFFELPIQIQTWEIQDADYGYYWIQSEGLKALSEYLDL